MITTREQIEERIRMIQQNVREGHSHLWALNGYDQETINRICSDAFRAVEKYQEELKAMGLPRLRLPKWI
jgi:hypothetical protein